ncbi:MAG: histidinol-phosphate transaminase [Muribaculaceae bacterium]|nr:histidinol-phosphate transaminase [Muribaculaceae bacterium]
MLNEIERLLRPNIKALEPYTCARDEYSGEAKAWLDANENSILNGLNRYPDPLQRQVKQHIGELRGVDPENIFLGVGSDECIDILYRTFCRPGIDNVVAIDPSYGMYSVCAAINDVEYRKVSLREDFSLDTDALLAACDANTKVMWICSPNNPTGNAFSLEEIETLAQSFEGILAVDEAYVDFSEKGSAIPMLERYPRLVVMQTFSKAWASAAIRLGIGYACRDIIDVFNKVKYPYNINILTQRQALAVLSDKERIARTARELVMLREDLALRLKNVDAVEEVYSSDANFILAKVKDADGIYRRLLDQGVVVRNRSRVHLCGNCLRLTVGTAAENDMLIAALEGRCIDAVAADDEMTSAGRVAAVHRVTGETDVLVSVGLDGSGKTDISTGLGFFDHMLDQIGRHGGVDLTVKVKGDLNVDEHHTIEDTALALGEALAKALHDKRGLERYGFCLPMDECRATVAIDFGGRPCLVWDVEPFVREKIGDMPTEMFRHFFKSLSDTAKCNLYIEAKGENEHHRIEGIFKAFARSLKSAVRRDPFNFSLPSTKGSL